MKFCANPLVVCANSTPNKHNKGFLRGAFFGIMGTELIEDYMMDYQAAMTAVVFVGMFGYVAWVAVDQHLWNNNNM